jgi:hypothetical protein
MSPRQLMLNGRLFQSPWGLLPFQVDAVAFFYLAESYIGVIDRGLGKSAISCALAAQLFEDDEIDLVIHVAQAGKLDKDEFPKDWSEWTGLRVHRYLGTGRQQRLQKAIEGGGVDVLLTSYETGKLELMRRVKTGSKRGRGKRVDGPLMDQLGLRGKRILWIFDECIKLAGRNSELYQAYDYLLGPDGKLRRGPHKQRVIGMSANPMGTDYVQSENIGLIINPDALPRITRFEEQFTYGKDDNGNHMYNRAAVEVFAPLFESRLVYRKRCTDEDVRHLIPQLDEMPLVKLRLDPMHEQLYDAVEKIYGQSWEDLDDIQRSKIASAQKILLGHPRALLRSDAEIPKLVVATLGEEVLRRIPSSKTLRLLEELKRLHGHQVLVFTFYAETVLPELVADLQGAGHRVGVYVGKDPVSLRAKQAFKAGGIDVLVSSDAGSRGLNLPEAHYIIEYDAAPSFEKRMQRFGRGQRLGSDQQFVYGITLVADRTIELGAIRSMMDRNNAQDHLLGDKGVAGYLSSEQRKKILEATA